MYWSLIFLDYEKPLKTVIFLEAIRLLNAVFQTYNHGATAR